MGDRILSDLRISIGSDRVFVGFPLVGIRPGFHRNPTQHHENPAGSGRIFMVFRWIPTKSGSDSDQWESDENLIGSDRFFYERCRILMKFDADPIENDQIYRSDWISWAGRIPTNGNPTKTLSDPIEILRSDRIWSPMNLLGYFIAFIQFVCMTLHHYHHDQQLMLLLLMLKL